MNYIPTSRTSVCVPIASSVSNSSVTSTSTTLVAADDLNLLQTGESCAFAFAFTEYSDLSGKPPGYPQIKWCTSMGEFSTYRGEFSYPRVVASSSTAAASSNPPLPQGSPAVGQAPGAVGSGSGGSAVDVPSKSIRYEVLNNTQPSGASSAATEMFIGEEREVVIRVYNITSRTMSVHLDCKNSGNNNNNAGGANSANSNRSKNNNNGSDLRPRLLSTNTTSASVSAVSNSVAANSKGTANNNNSNSNSKAEVDVPVAYNYSLLNNNIDANSANNSTSRYRGLCFCGLTFTPLGIIESLDFVDITVTVYATSAGLHDLPTLYVIDSIAGERHAVISACRIFVHDNEEEGDEEGGVAEAKVQKDRVEVKKHVAVPTHSPPAVHTASTPASVPVTLSTTASTTATTAPKSETPTAPTAPTATVESEQKSPHMTVSDAEFAAAIDLMTSVKPTPISDSLDAVLFDTIENDYSIDVPVDGPLDVSDINDIVFNAPSQTEQEQQQDGTGFVDEDIVLSSGQTADFTIQATDDSYDQTPVVTPTGADDELDV